MYAQLRNIYKYLQYEEKEACCQIHHRMALVNLWSPQPGDHIVEIGCGQGETTVVLAVAVENSGRVQAIDSGPAEYGSPVTLGDSQTFIRSSPIGDRIDFLLSTNLLNSQLNFPENMFDLVIFSHSSLYLSSAIELHQLFARVRPWAKSLGYAEWDLRVPGIRQTPHRLSILLQERLQMICPQMPTANTRCLIFPEDARLSAEKAGWSLRKEKVIDTSTPLEYGKSWEIDQALKMAEHLAVSDCHVLSDDMRATLLAEAGRLQRLSDKAKNLSLPTYVFLAE